MATEDKEKKKSISPKRITMIILWGILGTVAIWLIIGHAPLLGKLVADPKIASVGAYGDMFGFVNSLFSALAFFAVILTLWMQMEELKNQRKELQLQRDELKLSREEMAKAAEAQTRTATAQEAATKVQEKQIQTTLLATYTQGLIAMQQSPPIDKLSIPQEVFFERVAEMVQGIAAGETDVNGCTKASDASDCRPDDSQFLLRKRLRRIRRVVEQTLVGNRYAGTVVAADTRVRLEVIKDEFLSNERERQLYHSITYNLQRLGEGDPTINPKQLADSVKEEFSELYERVRSRLESSLLAVPSNEEKTND